MAAPVSALPWTTDTSLLMWAVVIREEMEAVEAASSHSGSPGDPDSKPSAGLIWTGNHNNCAGPGACTPVSWMDTEDVIPGVLRVLNIYQSGLGVITGGGRGKFPGGNGVGSDTGRLRGHSFANQIRGIWRCGVMAPALPPPALCLGVQFCSCEGMLRTCPLTEGDGKNLRQL